MARMLQLCDAQAGRQQGGASHSLAVCPTDAGAWLLFHSSGWVCLCSRSLAAALQMGSAWSLPGRCPHATTVRLVARRGAQPAATPLLLPRMRCDLHVWLAHPARPVPPKLPNLSCLAHQDHMGPGLAWQAGCLVAASLGSLGRPQAGGKRDWVPARSARSGPASSTAFGEAAGATAAAAPLASGP